MKIKHFILQSINIQALLKSITVLRNPTCIIPCKHYQSINDIDIPSLVNQGVSCIIFDKDNTLSTTYAQTIHPTIYNKVESFRTQFPQTLAILSNSVGSSDDFCYEGLKNIVPLLLICNHPNFILLADAIATEKVFNIPVIRHRSKKPNCLPEVSA